MEFRIKVEPRVVRASSKESLLHIIIGGHAFSIQNNATAHRPLLGSSRDTKVRVYNLHKVNAKYKQIKYKNSNPKTGAVKGRTRKSELVRKGEWIAYVYDFDLSLLKLAGLHVKQNERNFTVTKIADRNKIK